MNEISLKILWIHHELDGPINGLAQYGNEKVWFKKVEDQQSSYELIRLTPDTLNMVESNHLAYCNAMNVPIYHGEPFKIRKPSQINKTNEQPNEQGFTEANLRSLANIKTYKHSFDASTILGETIKVVRSEEFINYHVPHPIQM